MRRLLLTAVLASATLAGCMSTGTHLPVAAPKIEVARPAPIVPDDVTVTNARDKAKGLNEELDRAGDGEN